MYVCVCKAISDHEIRRAVAGGARTFEDVQASTGCTTCCGCCEDEARELVEAALDCRYRAAALPIAA